MDPTGAVASVSLYADNSPFQFLTGFALGEQVQAGATTSTCFGQAYQTKVFLDNIADQSYTIGLQLYQLDFAALTTNFGSLMLDVNNLFIQYNDQAIACEVQTKITQFATRTQTVSGFSNWVFTVGYGTLYPLVQSYLSAYLPAIAT